MALTVKDITDKTGKEEWFSLPWQIYREDPLWVPPVMSELRRTLDSRLNPYFRSAELRLFAAYRDGSPVARTAVIINPKVWKQQSRRSAMFGFFEADNDPGACQALFNEVEEHCLSRGIQCLEGPFNPNHYSELGMLSENYSDPPAFFETYNPPYYNSLMSETGFKVAGRLHTRINRQIGVYLSKKYDLSAPPAKKEGFTVRKFRLLNYGSDLECIRQVNNDAFSDNYRFLPLTKEEYRFAGKYMFLVTVPRLVIMVEHRGTPVAVLQCVLNINTILHALNGKTGVKESLDYLHRRRGLKELVIFSVGIRKAYQNSPVFVLLLHHICRLLKDYSVLSTTWMTDTNIPAIRAAERLGLHPYKWFDIFEKTF